MNGLLSFKSNTNSLKDIDVKKRIVTGYLSAFDNKDHDGDIIIKGAFKKSLGERKEQIYFLNQHNWKQPHGKFAVLEEDNKGLYFESEPLIDTSYSTDVIKLYDAGILKEHSIGFQTLKSDKENDARVIKEIKLYEGSNVTMGANSDTPFTGFKSLTMKEVNDKATLLYKAIKDGTFTDDTFILLEFALKELQNVAFNLGQNSQKIEPSLDTFNKNSAETIEHFINSI